MCPYWLGASESSGMYVYILTDFNISFQLNTSKPKPLKLTTTFFLFKLKLGTYPQITLNQLAPFPPSLRPPPLNTPLGNPTPYTLHVRPH